MGDAAGELSDRLETLGLAQGEFGRLAPLRFVMQPARALKRKRDDHQ